MSSPDATLDEAVLAAAARVGAAYGMTAEQIIACMVLGDQRHPDAPDGVCGATDPRRQGAWCALAARHPGEDHNEYAPRDGCRTWTQHDRHQRRWWRRWKR